MSRGIAIDFGVDFGIASVVFDPEAHLVQEQSKVRSISMICFVIVHLVSMGK